MVAVFFQDAQFFYQLIAVNTISLSSLLKGIIKKSASTVKSYAVFQQ
jgi:hypothetical protein